METTNNAAAFLPHHPACCYVNGCAATCPHAAPVAVVAAPVLKTSARQMRADYAGEAKAARAEERAARRGGRS